MSLNAIHRSVMVFASSQEKAEEKLIELTNELDENEEVLLQRKDYVKTTSRTFTAKKFHEGCRGYRYQKVYVDLAIATDENMYNLIIPKLVPPSYYDMSRFGEEWNWRDHVVYF